MSDILEYKALSNKIEAALKEKVIGDVHVEYNFDPSAFGMVIAVAIDDPTKKYTSYSRTSKLDSRWYYHAAVDEFNIKNLFDDSKLISEMVSDILYKYKEYIYKRYFFD